MWERECMALGVEEAEGQSEMVREEVGVCMGLGEGDCVDEEQSVGGREGVKDAHCEDAREAVAEAESEGGCEAHCVPVPEAQWEGVNVRRALGEGLWEKRGEGVAGGEGVGREVKVGRRDGLPELQAEWAVLEEEEGEVDRLVLPLSVGLGWEVEEGVVQCVGEREGEKEADAHPLALVELRVEGVAKTEAVRQPVEDALSVEDGDMLAEPEPLAEELPAPEREVV